jgi:predicted ATPase
MDTTIGGRYRIEDRIGQGGMGAVYRGVDTHTGQPVAIKVLLTGAAGPRPEEVARFRREGEALRQLDHPNIVKIEGMIEEDARHYIVMEYVSGGSLDDLLRDTPQLPVERVLAIALELADALTRAHHLHVVHRDIKPANVLLAEDGTPRLTDFGTALIAGLPHLTRPSAVIGTPYYISPEAIQGQQVDRRADIWSFGVMLYEMLAGARPFTADLLSALALAIVQHPTPDLEQIRPDAPVALVDLVYRMLEKDPNARVPSARLVGAELEAIQLGLAVSIADGTIPPAASDVTQISNRFVVSSPSAGLRQHNLPAQTTPFVGRDDELHDLAALLTEAQTRLITILGPGGIGKTRLALEVAARHHEHSPQAADGVYFVPLAALEDVTTIVPAIAEAVGFQFYGGGDPQQQLLDFLADKRLLLVLDNFEHVLEAADLVTAILQAAPDVQVLVTSRERLNLQGETLFRIQGMAVPDGVTPGDALEYSAIKLFVQGARRAWPGFDLAAEDVEHVATICRLVGGMPLGILLAAAWVAMIGPAEIAGEIARSLDFLDTDMRNVPDRHRSLRTIFESSWARLSADEQETLKRLSVFRGGFTQEAAREVTGAGLRGLMGLVNKSFMHRDPRGRYEIHNILRQYAEHKFDGTPGEKEQVLDRHSDYYAAFLHQREAYLKGGLEQGALAEIENLRAAWQWALARGRLDALRQAMIGLFWLYNGQARFQEGEAIFRRAAEAFHMDRPHGVLYGQFLALQGWFPLLAGYHAEGGELLRRGIAILRDLDARAALALPLLFAGRWGVLADAGAALEESLAIAEATGDRWIVATAHQYLGINASENGAYAAARRYLQRSQHVYASIGDQWGVAICLMRLGDNALTQCDFPAAREYFQRSLAAFRQISNRRGTALSLDRISSIAHVLGEDDQAEALIRESLAIRQQLGYRDALFHHTLDLLGTITYDQGDYAQARRIYRECLAIAEDLGLPQRVALGHKQLGFVLGALGEDDAAWEHFVRALQMALEDGATDVLVDALIGVAGLLARRGELTRAAELAALADAHPSSAPHLRHFRDEAALQQALKSTLADYDAAWARGRGRDLDAAVAEVLAGV